MSSTRDLNEFIKSKNVSKFGFADISDMNIENINGEKLNFKPESGIVFYLKLDPEVISNINNGPTEDYISNYTIINKKLDSVGLSIEKYLINEGYNAYAQTVSRTGFDKFIENKHRNTLPHKTLGTKAGLGWVGKCALFVTKDYGSAIRLSSVITDCKLEYGKPVTKALCKNCIKCKEACIGNAVSGINWNNKLKIDDFFNYRKCLQATHDVCMETFGKDYVICGKCINVCPYTRRYIKRSLK